ncbi:MAG: DUF4886 domain-containing protein [Verrucomicrobiota bacterium]
MRPYSFFFPLFISSWLCFSSAAIAESEPVRVLFVGNSYTGQIKNTVQRLVSASPNSDAKLEFINPGGRNLQQHLDNPDTVARIQEGGWDFVVLQDQSQTPAVFPDQFASAAKALDKIIDDADAQTVFYLTWGRRDGDKRNLKLFPTYQKMQDALSDAYSKSARRADAKLAPVGEVWRAVREADEELGRALYKNDGSHPSAKGAYLAACVFYATLFDADPADVPYVGDLSKTEAELIRKLTLKVVALP